LYEGAVIDTLTELSPEEIAEMVGAFATTPAVAITDVLDTPAPRAFMARSTTGYALPLESPEMTSGEVVDTGDRVIHVEPLLMEY
jgi:hypothetical protein